MLESAQFLPSSFQFVAVTGHMGLRKSDFAQALWRYMSSHKSISLHIENARHDNPFLEDFYAKPQRWAFHSQVHIMLSLAREMQQAVLERKGCLLLSDHIPGYEDVMVYSQLHYNLNYISDREWNTLLNAFELLQVALPHPNIVIYLRSENLKRLHEEINYRGRPGDSEITFDYLKGLDQRFASMIGNMTDTYLIQVPIRSSFGSEIEDYASKVGDSVLSYLERMT